VSLKSKKILKPHLKNGIGFVNLSRDGKKYTRQINQLVAKAFIPNPENRELVKYIDRDFTNNHVSNLKWSSYDEI
jgi:hypothetical protein